MEERIKLTLLFDAYGNLLTDKQRRIMDLYYNCDLSLAEIAEHTDTSRQAVYDIIKRCHKLLLQYEDKLELVKYRADILKSKNLALKMLDSIKNAENKASVEDIKKFIMDNIN